MTEQQSASGQWVYTNQYGWVWMPYGNSYTYVRRLAAMRQTCTSITRPSVGAGSLRPRVWGWGPMPFFGVYGTARIRVVRLRLRPLVRFRGAVWRLGWSRGLEHGVAGPPPAVAHRSIRLDREGVVSPQAAPDVVGAFLASSGAVAATAAAATGKEKPTEASGGRADSSETPRRMELFRRGVGELPVPRRRFATLP